MRFTLPQGAPTRENKPILALNSDQIQSYTRPSARLLFNQSRQQGIFKPILALTEANSKLNLDFSNLVRPDNSLVHNPIVDGNIADKKITAIHSPFAEKYGKGMNHIGRAQRLHNREGAAASLRPGSVVALPFAFNNPKLSEV